MATNVAIVGAGPYGLSLAAMLRGAGVEHRVFGTPMRTWREAMPRGMFLKSEGFASDLYGPGAGFTLGDYCARQALPYRDSGLPVPLDVFTSYGEAFQRECVPQLETKDVARIAPTQGGFDLELADGERCQARRVVVAAGISHFAYVPPALADLPPALGGHASCYTQPEEFAGRRVAVVGAGASATDYAFLLAQAGATVHLITRQPKIAFLGPPSPHGRSWRESIKAPQSGLGPGWRSRLATDAPLVFHYMPESFRVLVARRHLGPAGGWWTRATVEQQVQVHTETSIGAAAPRGDQVALDLVGEHAAREPLLVDQVIAATGYRPDLSRLGFLAPALQSLPTVAGAARLSSNFESAAAGLYFVGLSSVYDFGPLVRFAFGANFTARRLSRHLAARSRSRVAAAHVAAPPYAAAAPAIDPI